VPFARRSKLCLTVHELDDLEASTPSRTTVVHLSTPPDGASRQVAR